MSTTQIVTTAITPPTTPPTIAPMDEFPELVGGGVVVVVFMFVIFR